MEKERTLVLIKPDGLVRHLIGRIITRFEDAGLKLVALKMKQADEELAGAHYTQEIADKYGDKVRNGLIKYILEGPVIAMVIEGVDAIKVVRKIVGSTYPNDSQPGTIRGDYAHISKDFANAKEVNVRNLIHASSSKEDAEKEIDLWFNKDEFCTYTTAHEIICFRE